MLLFLEVWNLKKIIYILVLYALSTSIQVLYAAAATVNVDYNAQITSYDPAKLLGANSTCWVDYNPNFSTNLSTIKSAGSVLIRFPGGSVANEYHWNGTGSYDANNVWNPSVVSFTPGFMALPLGRGSTSPGYGFYSVLMDGDTSNNSQWKSDTTTAAAIVNNPYLAVILDSPQQVTAFKIYWGPSYAKNYEIQRWTGGAFNISIAYTDTSQWVTVATVTNGAGGVDTCNIPATTAQSIRLLIHQPASVPGSGFTVNEVELYNGAIKLTNNTASPSGQTAVIASPGFQANAASGWRPNFSFLDFINMLNSLGSGAMGVVIVDFGIGTPEEAAAWVQYAKSNGYLPKIKYWEIGNENDGTWETTGPVDAEYYALRFIKFVQQMKAVDASIKIAGPVISWINNISQKYDGQSYMDTFLGILQAQGALNLLDIIDWHMYPNWANNNEATTLATSDNWQSGQNWKAYVEGLVNKYYGSPNAKDLLLSEYNSGSATLLLMDFMNALWTANWDGEYAKAFGPRANACLWAVFNNDSTPGNYDTGYLEIGQQAGSYKYQPRSSYWAMYMINNYLSCPDPFGNTVVTATSNQALLPVYAVRRSDGVLSLMVINKDKVNDYQASINISNFNVDYSAGLYTFSSAAYAPYYIQNYVLHDASRTYIDPDLPPQVNTFTAAANNFNFDFPPYTISIFNFTPAPAPVDMLIDNCDDGDNRNNMAGYWYTYDDNPAPNYGTSYVVPMNNNYATAHSMTPVPFYMQATGYTDTGMAARITGYVTNTYAYGFIGMGIDLKNPLGPQNIFCCQGIRFWQKGDGNSYRVRLMAPAAYPTDGVGGNMYGWQFTPTSAWSQITVPFSSMTQEGAPTPWGNDHPSLSQVLGEVQGIQWQTVVQPLASINLWVDQIEIYQCSGGCITYPTPTYTVTLTSTITPTPASPQNLDNSYIFPSLVNLSGANDGVTFYKLPSHVSIKLFNIVGELVYTADTDITAGQFFMKLKQNQGGTNIAAGIYIYTIIDKERHVKIGKIAVIW
jgi:hypothetical protein